SLLTVRKPNEYGASLSCGASYNRCSLAIFSGTIAMAHLWLLLVLCFFAPVLAQSGSLRGQVTDQNGGSVPGAKVTVNGPSGLVKTTNTDKSGSYSFAGLPAGDYDVQASAPNLELAEPVKVSFKGGIQPLDLQLEVVLAPEKV